MKLATILLAMIVCMIGFVDAQTYTGVNNSVLGCGTTGCHTVTGRAQYTNWLSTPHAKAYDSIAIIQNNPTCLPCHTTGWDTLKTIGGFSDYYPPVTHNDTLGIDRTRNVQCEACHGPVQFGVNHGNASTINSTAEQCGSCHQGEHHPYYSEWAMAKHAVSDTNVSGYLTGEFRNNSNCSGCHTYQGFLQFVSDTSLVPNVTAPGNSAEPIVCAACHDPHSNTNIGQLRKPPAELCQKCHNPEYNPDTPTPDGSAIHHSTAYMLEGKGGYHYDTYTYQSSMHKFVATDKCVACHIVMTPFISMDQPASTGHTFEPKGKKCYECHSDFDTLNVTFNYRNIQTKIDSLSEVLNTKLASASSSDSVSTAFYRAKFNYDFVQADGSHGIHNTKYAEGLLESAIANFIPTTSVEIIDNTVPLKFELSQNYPNPFNPTTSISFAIASKEHVVLQIYDVGGNLISTLVDKDMSAGTYRIVWSCTNNSGMRVTTGVYLYKIMAGSYTESKKMILLK
jgi:predicted CXXCH cytochrome family protein